MRATVRPVPVWVCGVTGFAGSVSILAGVALAGSPFSVHAPGAWFFGTGAGRPPGTSGFPAVMLVYAGIAVLLAAWFELVRTVRRQPRVPVSRLAAILAAWVLPVLVMPPAFSRDIYSYVAQGELVDRGLSPYLRTPSALCSAPSSSAGGGATPGRPGGSASRGWPPRSGSLPR